jgi:L-aspartate oxidase
MTESVKTDFLVLGSGIAGLIFALEASKYGNVVIVTKKNKAESNTNYAQGGIASVFGKDDNYACHVQDTLISGAGLCHKDAVELLVKEGPERVKELMDLGAHFTTKNGSLDLGREGGHSKYRIVHSKDFTGREVERALLEKISQNRKITLLENHIAIDLITERNFKSHPETTQAYLENPVKNCWGAYVFNSDSRKVIKIVSKISVLATGGLGQVYPHTTNPKIATGDGIALGFRAGAKIGNLEFIQFHPTTLYLPGANSFLISEAIRGFGAILKTKDGKTFMEKYDERGCLATRDIVARAIDKELKIRGDDFVYLDVSHKSAESIKENFPSIYEKCLSLGLDITKEPIPVVPAAHFSCGGIVTNLEGETNINGLYASGEVSMTGVHGANRLASNSLLEALVYSHISAISAGNKLATIGVHPEILDWDESGTFNNEEWILISHNRKEIQSIMDDYVGIVRSDLRLERALRRVNLIYSEVEEFYKKTKVNYEVIELRNLCLIAKLIIISGLNRKESRGLHFTTDYSVRDDENWLKDIILSRSKSGCDVELKKI